MWTIHYRGFYIHGSCGAAECRYHVEGGFSFHASSLDNAKRAIRATYVRKARAMSRLGNALLRAWDREVSAAVEVYGDVAMGKHVSGCYNPEFPDAVKDHLRALARHGQQWKDAARYQCKLAGLRRAGTDAIVTKSGAYYG